MVIFTLNIEDLMMSVKKLPVIPVTKEQREWLESKSNETCESITSIVRGLIQAEVNKVKKYK
jgi:hypothetical protein